MNTSWRMAWSSVRFRIAFLVTIISLIAALSAYSSFLRFVDSRPGVVLDDPILGFLAPEDCSTVTFMLIYGCLVSAVILLLRSPRRLMLTLLTYTAMVIMRIGVMYLIPLDPPDGMIVLRDPVVEMFGPGAVLTRDLFFSGHTATLVILFLTSPSKVWRIVFGVAAASVAFLLLLQHAHYTVDVVAAPVFAYCAFVAANQTLTMGGIDDSREL